MLSAHACGTGEVLADKGCQQMDAADLDIGIAYWHSNLRYDAARVRRVCALESSLLVCYYSSLKPAGSPLA